MKKLFLLLFLMTISLGQSQNMISNSYFTTNAAGWSGTPDGSVSGGEYVFATTANGPQQYSTEVKFSGLTVNTGSVYTATFRAKCASGTRNIIFQIQQNGSWGVPYVNTAVALTTTMQVFTLTFTAGAGGGAGCEYQFHLAGSGSTTGVTIDDATLVAGTATQCTNFIQDGTETGVDCGGSCAACKVNPTFNAYTVGPKFVGAATFSATASSNSTGAFTYTSATPSVATINSTTGIVTVVGAGTTLITATQAADATYYAGSTSATLTVSYAAPASGAPAPIARNAWDVVSVYSGAYTDLVGTNFNPNWGQVGFGTAAEVALSGNNARYYPNFNYQGNELPSATNVANMTTLHLDIYSNDLVGFDLRLIGGGEFSYILSPNPVAGQWNSYDVPLSSFGALNTAAVIQLKYQTNPFQPSSPRNFYLDNVYFYRAATSAPPATLGALTIPNKYVGDAAFSLTAPTTNSSGAFTYTSSNAAVATISGSTVTIVGKGTSTITASQAADATYSAASTTASLVVSTGSPANAAPTPTVPAGNVINVFSDAAGYGPANTNNFFPGWGQNTVVTTPSIAGNPTLLYSNLNYEGTVLTPNLNLTGYVSMHLDVWTQDCNSLQVFLINTAGAESSVTVTPSLAANASASWNQFDIILSSYTHNITNIKEIKIVGTDGSTVYLDNIYFSNVAIIVNPTIGALTIPTKPVGAANFNITAPSTNSPGAITYTSSNSAVATITGVSVTVVGVGSTTITASQAASGSFNAGSVTGTFTVVAAAPTVAAPTPPARGAADVVSVFSGAYTNVAGTDFNPNWGQDGFATYAQVAIAGNNTLHYPNLNYQGNQFATNLNVSSMVSLHLDIWTPVSSSVRVYCIPGGASSYVDVPLTIGSWTSIDIPMTSFNLTSNQLNGVAGVNQFKFDGTPFGGSILFLDNIYFWKPNNIPSFGVFTIPTKFTTSVPFNLTAPTSTSPGAITYTSSNTAVATVSGSTVTIIGAGTSTITANQAASGGFLAASTFATLTVTTAPPTVAATSPTLPSFQVMSVYSNKYTPTSGVGANSFVPNWGQSEISTNVAIAGNTTRKYGKLNYHGVQFDSPLNISNMEAIHLDIYSSNCTSLDFYLINQTVREVKKTIALPLQSGWNSINIPISDFLAANAALDLTNIGQFKFDNVTGSRGIADVYIDNVYFWNDGITQLRPGFCGKTLRSLTDPIQASPLAGATEYTFEVTRVSNNAVTTIVSPKYLFNPSTSIAGGLVWSATYSVKVKAKIGGFYGDYGNTCIVTVPTEPVPSVTKIRPFQCNATLLYMTQTVEATPVYLATTYEFEVTSGAGTFVASSPNYTFSLYYSVPGRALTGTTYSIKVRSKGDASAFTAWGDACDVKTPIARMSEVSTNDVFEVKSFPNPFASHFSLDIESSSDAQVEMKVYDMIGRQLEVRKASVSELSVLEVGRNYPTGIYNLVVSQGKNVKSIRMIKR